MPVQDGSSGHVHHSDIDARALDVLALFPPSAALAALEDIQNRELFSVRSKRAFIMSIFKRVVRSVTNPYPDFGALRAPPRRRHLLPPVRSAFWMRLAKNYKKKFKPGSLSSTSPRPSISNATASGWYARPAASGAAPGMSLSIAPRDASIGLCGAVHRVVHRARQAGKEHGA